MTSVKITASQGRSFLSPGTVNVVPAVTAPGADFAYSSTPRLGGALPRLYRTILALTSACFFFLCLSVRFMAFDEVGPARCSGSAICPEAQTDTAVEIDTVPPEPTARSLKEDVKPMDHTPYGAVPLRLIRPAPWPSSCSRHQDSSTAQQKYTNPNDNKIQFDLDIDNSD
ncbi:uncharacterized protein LOC142765076 isoform X2 [Rhipicephalus microplus]|uniref:uncharacterized protein LOC142765076 isoform X2 n=1 Tax=Rhipicephalus microplus TaxID=6941 RepID=UPI003F6C51DC